MVTTKDLSSLAEQFDDLFSQQQLIRQVHPVLRLFLIVLLGLVFMLQSLLGFLLFLIIFSLLAYKTPFNPVERPKLLLYIFLLATASLLLDWLVSDQALRDSFFRSVLLFGKLFVLISIGIYFKHVIDYSEVAQLFRGVPLLQRLRPSLLSFLRVMTEAPEIYNNNQLAALARGYRCRPFSLHRFRQSVPVRLGAAVTLTLQFISEYADTLGLRGAASRLYRPYRGRESTLLSYYVAVLCLILLLVFVADQMGLIVAFRTPR